MYSCIVIKPKLGILQTKLQVTAFAKKEWTYAIRKGGETILVNLKIGNKGSVKSSLYIIICPYYVDFVISPLAEDYSR